MSISAIDKPRDTLGVGMDVVAEFFRNLTAERFLRLGVLSVVYCRSRIVDGDPAYALYSADGVLVSVVEDIQAATLLANKHGMAVVTVH